MKLKTTTSRRGFLLAAIVALTTAGCGGGGGGNPEGPGPDTKTPSDVTRAQVQKMHTLALRAMTQVGGGMTAPTPPPMIGGGSGSGGDSAEGGVGQTPLPLIGSFLRSVAAVPPATRAARRLTRQSGDDDSSASMTVAPYPMPPPDGKPYPETTSTYHDLYLGLWVEVTDKAGETKYLLFEDEAKTRPAGSIVTTWPVSWDTFPQVYGSTYEFTAGFLAGARGFSQNTTNADWSGSAKYETVYQDGWKDSGESAWSARGGYSWKSRTETADGQWTEGRGGTLGNGDTGIHLETSDGMISDYTYTSNGSGHGTITGPLPGLPVTIDWNARGNTTIQYADGSIEIFPGGGPGYGGPGYGGGGGPVPVPIAIAEDAPPPPVPAN